MAFSMMTRAVLGIFLQKDFQLFVDDALDERAHLAVAQLGLGLGLELRVLQLDADDGSQALADVLAGELFLGLEDVVFPPVVVEHAGDGGLEAGLMRAAVYGVHIVGEREDGLVIGVVVLASRPPRCSFPYCR